jgi:hypothetical protein
LSLGDLAKGQCRNQSADSSSSQLFHVAENSAGRWIKEGGFAQAPLGTSAKREDAGQ